LQLPIVDNQAQVNFVQNKASGVLPFLIGALTKEVKEEMAELFDMKNCGAIAFGDYNKSQDNANLLKIALQYVQDFDGLVIAFPKTKK
jgi:dihydroorotase